MPDACATQLASRSKTGMSDCDVVAAIRGFWNDGRNVLVPTSYR